MWILSHIWHGCLLNWKNKVLLINHCLSDVDEELIGWLRESFNLRDK